jgi:DNA polymerase-1
MLESYLLNPTHASHTLPDIAARTTSLALTHQPSKENPSDPKRLPEAAAAVARLAITLSEQLAESAAPATRPARRTGPRRRVSKEMLFADRVQGPGPSVQQAKAETHTLSEPYPEP